MPCLHHATILDKFRHARGRRITVMPPSPRKKEERKQKIRIVL
jgi:hypothetical protein